jgi:hypothetical protein
MTANGYREIPGPQVTSDPNSGLTEAIAAGQGGVGQPKSRQYGLCLIVWPRRDEFQFGLVMSKQMEPEPGEPVTDLLSRLKRHDTCGLVKQVPEATGTLSSAPPAHVGRRHRPDRTRGSGPKR